MILSREILAGILLVLFIASLVGGLSYWRKHQREKVEELATLVYRYELGELKREEVEKKLKGTPSYAYFLMVSGEAEKALPLVEDDQLRTFLEERKAYKLYTSGRAEEAVEILDRIDKDKFNYPSALLLKAFSLEKKGDRKSAKEIYRELTKEFGGTYFGRVAYGFLLTD